MTLDELADEAGRMAMLLLVEAAQVEERRTALSRYGLGWWQGEAAAAYQRRVHDRVVALSALSARLEAAARLWETIEEAADEAVLDATGSGGLPWR